MPHGPFKNAAHQENMSPGQGRERELRFLYRSDYERDTREYFEGRQAHLNTVATTQAPDGRILDWVPVESQVPGGEIADPPPSDAALMASLLGEEQPAITPLGESGAARGPAGTVPVPRKRLDQLGYTKPLSQYLQKAPQPYLSASAYPAPEIGGHAYAASGQPIICFGGEGVFSCFSPYTETSDDFSLLQIGLANHDRNNRQTVEAGWQESQDLYGDWVPHLFVFYTTNNYTSQGDNIGGYNQDVDGWIQVDNTIFPETTFVPYSVRGGEQRSITIKYQLWQNNWWLQVQGRWVGYYPARLFMGNESVFETLGDHADHINFFGEVFDSDEVAGRTGTDLGSGYMPTAGWTWSAYMHNLAVQTDRAGTLAGYDGTAGVLESDPDMYGIEPHFGNSDNWASYAWVGGPGAN